MPPKVQITALHGYAGQYKEIANRIKNERDDEALEFAAQEMAKKIKSNAVLVPAPSSSGTNKAMFILAHKIAKHVGDRYVVVVMEVVKRKYPVPKSHLLRKQGRRPLTPEAQAASMYVTKQLSDSANIIVIDNVVSGANTIKGMAMALGRPIKALVYADASRHKIARRNPAQPLVVVISGSRNYQALEKIEQVIKTIPAGSIVLHGGAVGVDEYAHGVAKSLGLQIRVVLPNWEKYGRAAGPIRNKEMVSQADYVICFWNGKSAVTASTLKAAQKLGVEYQIVYDQE